MKKTSLAFILIVPAILLAGCAGQVPPQGGPVDMTPPEVIATVPDSNATRVTTDAIDLSFSEYVDRRSVEESIFISPYVGTLEFDWSGTSVRVTFEERLRPATTYVVNIGTDVTDVRAGNRMAGGYTLAFSTGDSIDRASISGRVYDERSEGVMVFAYKLDGIARDTLDPTHTKPDFIVQTGRGGKFVLSHLAMGTYRVLAVRDEYKNLIYDREIDQYGVLTGDVSVSVEHPDVSGLMFRLAKEDTTRPFITAGGSPHRQLLTVRLSEPIDTLRFFPANVHCTDTLTGVPVALTAVGIDREAPTVLYLMTRSPLDSARGYRINLLDIYDRSGNRMRDSLASVVVSGGAVRDTTRQQVTIIGLPDSSRSVAVDARFRIRFSVPLAPGAAANGISLVDSAKKTVAVKMYHRSPWEIIVTPRQPLQSRVWYAISIPLDSVEAWNGEMGRDTTVRMRFETVDLRSTGGIEGIVEDAQGVAASGPIILTASGIETTPPRGVRVTIKGPGPFQAERLSEGLYALDAFRDADSTGTYSAGRPFPFWPAERFVVYADTLKVRARWGIEGVKIQLR